MWQSHGAGLKCCGSIRRLVDVCVGLSAERIYSVCIEMDIFCVGCPSLLHSSFQLYKKNVHNVSGCVSSCLCFCVWMNECVVIVMPLAFSPGHNESHNRLNGYCILMQGFKMGSVCDCVSFPDLIKLIFMLLYCDWFISAWSYTKKKPYVLNNNFSEAEKIVLYSALWQCIFSGIAMLLF